MLTTRTTHLFLRAARLFVAWCWFAVYAVCGVTSMPSYRDNAALAVATTMARAGITTEDMDALLDGFLAYKEIKSPDADVAQDAAVVYRAVTVFSSLDSDQMTGLGLSWHYPSSQSKSPLSVLRYASLKDKAKRCLQHKKDNEPMVFLSREQWRATAEAVDRLVANVSEAGQEKFADVYAFARTLSVGGNPFDGLSYKDMRKLAATALAYTEGVKFADMYILDVLVKPRFCEAVGEDIDRLLVVARKLSYERLIDIVFDLPDRTKVTYNLVRYLFGELFVEAGYDLSLCAHFVEGLQSLGIAENVQWAPIQADVTALLSAPAPQTQADWDALAPDAESLWERLGLSALAPAQS